jgi:hypothetical protein
MALVEVEPLVAEALALEPAIVVAEGELVIAEAAPVAAPGVQAGRVVVQRVATNVHRAVAVARAAGALPAVARMAVAVVLQQVRAGMALGARLGLDATRVRMLE